jgi:superoxide dismutase, Fe-Mn family
MKKRTFLKTMGLFSASSLLYSFNTPNQELDDTTLEFTIDNQLLVDEKFTLPNLPYAVDALVPHIDKATMEIHHGKHHKAYIDNLNKAIQAGSQSWNSLEEIVQKLNKKSDSVLRNNAGGHWNHSFFWESITPNATAPNEKITNAINEAFGSFDAFKTAFTKAATGQFGSGWAWLCKNKNGKLFITSTPNQDNPLMKKLVKQAGVPLLGIDVWEHAYYLQYQNKRADYVNAFYKIINWEKVAARM